MLRHWLCCWVLGVVLAVGTVLGGVSEGDKCSAGKYYNETQVSCVPCPPGTFQGHDDSTAKSCEKCAKGRFAAVNGSTSCQPCEGGHYQDNEESFKCKICPKGTFSDTSEGSTMCVQCHPGYYQDEEGKIECRKCDRMFFQDEEGAKECKYCPSNTYQDNTGQATCKPCPDQKDNIPEGCKWRQCPQGYKKQEIEGGGTSCLLCEKGTYQPKEDGTECVPCPRGTYGNRRGMVHCYPCPANSWTPSTGRTSFYDCTGPSLQLILPTGSTVIFEEEKLDKVPLEGARARVLSGIWEINDVEHNENELIELTSPPPTLRPIINNVFCYFPDYLSDFRGKINKTSDGTYCSVWPDDEGGNTCTVRAKRAGISSELPEPWCLNGDDVPQSCGVPKCGWDNVCTRTKQGASYRGHVSYTSRGYTCRGWYDRWPHPNTDYPNAERYGVGKHNYCRNPDTGFPELFCYTTNWFKRYDECRNVPVCDKDRHPIYVY